MNIKELKVADFIISALEKNQIKELTPIQEKSITEIMDKKDVVLKARTGSGKTFAFLIPAIDNIDVEEKKPQVLVIAPTRELALQITEEARKLTQDVEGYKVVPLVGATSYQRQLDNIRKGAKIVVGTPGRLIDHLERRSLKLQNLKNLIIDEADEMLDMGFRDDILKIESHIKHECQKILCSATFDKEVKDLISKTTKDHVFIDVEDNYKNKAVTQNYVYTHQDKKIEALIEILEKNSEDKSIIFCNTKKMVDKITTLLLKKGKKAIGLHSDKTQRDRKQAIKKITEGSVQYLVATDVAARGLDIKNIGYIINFDIPYSAKSYTHRIGRAGRAGDLGRAITIVNKKNQLSQMRTIIKDSDNTIEEKIIDNTRDNTRNTGSTRSSRSTRSKNVKSDKKDRNNTNKKNVAKEHSKFVKNKGTVYNKFKNKEDIDNNNVKTEKNNKTNNSKKKTKNNMNNNKNSKNKNYRDRDRGKRCTKSKQTYR